MSGAARRSRGALLAATVLVVLLVLGVTGVVLALRSFEGRAPTRASCTATDGTTTARLAPDQTGYAALFAAIAMDRGLPARAVTIAIATGMQESRMRNIDYGDRDSLGLFQQRPSQGWGTPEQVMDPVYATNAFYDGLVQVEGYQDMEITVAAQAVQRSGFPDAYAQHEPLARVFASALTGYSPASLQCTLPDDDAEGAGGAAGTGAALLELLARDHPSVTTSEDADGVVLTIGGGDTERLTWALAHWAVATAEETGVRAVVVADREWTRDGDGWATTQTRVEGVVVR